MHNKTLLLAVSLRLVMPDLSLTPASFADESSNPREVRVQSIPYHGWDDCYLLRNGVVETVIVPAIGRVMQFRFAGEETGPFWENRAMDGKSTDPKSREWGNFGGDKSWPSPQAEWPKVTGRGWPPPVAFDSMPVTVTPVPGGVDIANGIDPHYGIRATRRVRLSSGSATMRIETQYTRLSGEENPVSVWVITQLKDPVRMYAPVPAMSIFPSLFDNQGQSVPPSLKIENRMISMERDASKSFKIGSDAGTLLWIGEKVVVKIESPREAGKPYPDNGSSGEIYTNGDPNRYVELEMLGPLEKLKIGGSIQRASSYTLLRRKQANADAEARDILSSR